jgi:hypothetical protein
MIPQLSLHWGCLASCSKLNVIKKGWQKTCIIAVSGQLEESHCGWTQEHE